MWKYVSYFQKGISHIKSATNCQDSVLVKENENGIIAALADGLGSLKYSEIAAQTVTETVCDCFLRASFPNNFNSEKFKTSLRDALITEIKKSLSQKASEANISSKDMDCTLVFVYVSKSINQAIAGRLGDSAICVIKESNSIAINDSNKSANGTNAILDDDSNEHLDLFVYNLDTENIYGFILTSDGLDNELYMKGSSHVNKAAELYFNSICTDPQSGRKAIEDAIEKLTFDENSPFDDDISIAVLSRASKPISFGNDPTWLCSCGARNRLQDTYCQKCNKDFTVLYSGIRFKDYGGKAAFFTKINENPDEERKLVGLPRKGNTQPEHPAFKSVVPQNSTTQSPQPKSNHTATTTQSAQKPCENNQTQHNPGVPPLKAVSPVPYGAAQDAARHGGYQPRNEVQNDNNSGGNRTTHPPKTEVSNLSYKNKPKKQQSRVWTVIAAAVAIFVVGIIVGSVFSKMSLAKRIDKLSDKVDALVIEVKDDDTDGNKPQESINPTDSSESNIKLPDDFIVLSNGSYFWGKLNNGIPNGEGVLLEGGNYYIGKFDNGQKDGVFTVVSQNNPSDIKTITYKGDREVDNQGQTSDPSNTEEQHTTYKISHYVNIRSDAGTANERIGFLNQGETVSVISLYPKMVEEEEWVQIRTSEGKEGWIIAEVLEDYED